MNISQRLPVVLSPLTLLATDLVRREPRAAPAFGRDAMLASGSRMNVISADKGAPQAKRAHVAFNDCP